MSTTAQSIIHRVTQTLGDFTSIKWTVDRLVRYLNDGQRDILTHRPDALNLPATLALVAGHKQTLPANGEKLINILANTNGSKRAVTKVMASLLDAQIHNWRSMTPTTEILHFMYDPREPRSFEVYPPAALWAQPLRSLGLRYRVTTRRRRNGLERARAVLLRFARHGSGTARSRPAHWRTSHPR